ncbi:hypothetical protein ACOSP7_012628 [Xanthoceras sorbifolium]
MESNSEVTSNVQIMEKILRTLNVKFEYKVTVIEESKDLETMTLAGVLREVFSERLIRKLGLDANPALNTYECLNVLHMLMCLMF